LTDYPFNCTETTLEFIKRLEYHESQHVLIKTETRSTLVADSTES